MQHAALKDISDMQEQAFDTKEEFQDMLYLEFSNQFQYFYGVFSIQTESQALNRFGMIQREFRAFRRRNLAIFELVRDTFHKYMRHIIKKREMRQLLTKVDRCANRLVILRDTPERKDRLRDLQCLREHSSRLF